MIIQMMKIGLVVLVLGVMSPGRVYAEEEPEAEIIKVETKEVIGEVISFSPVKNPIYIGIAYEGANYEAFFMIDENIRIVHKKSLDEIKLGDMVSVTYEETTRVTEGGREQTERIAKVIKFVKQGTGSLRRVPGETRKSEESSATKALSSVEKKK